MPIADFDLAEQIFDKIYAEHPTRFEDLDTYSNILYVMGKRGKLSQVAQKYAAIDRDRPETCCLIGDSVWIMSVIPMLTLCHQAIFTHSEANMRRRLLSSVGP